MLRGVLHLYLIKSQIAICYSIRTGVYDGITMVEYLFCTEEGEIFSLYSAVMQLIFELGQGPLFGYDKTLRLVMSWVNVPVQIYGLVPPIMVADLNHIKNYVVIKTVRTNQPKSLDVFHYPAVGFSCYLR